MLSYPRGATVTIDDYTNTSYCQWNFEAIINKGQRFSSTISCRIRKYDSGVFSAHFYNQNNMEWESAWVFDTLTTYQEARDALQVTLEYYVKNAGLED